MVITETQPDAPVEQVVSSDHELLSRFSRQKDEAAFEEIVVRHGPLVLGVCQRILRNNHDAEDAFQATFLVLSRKARRIRKSTSLGSWLYGVAYRISIKASKKKRGLKELFLRSEPMDSRDTLDIVADAHDRELVDHELNQLPEKYRDPLVLHYLMGKSNKDIATELGETVGAIEGRLKRGKHELRTRLARRGVNLAIVMTAIHTIQSSAQACVSTELIASTVKTGISFSVESAKAHLSGRAVELAIKELGIMSAKTSTAALLVAATVLGTLGFSGNVDALGTENAGKSSANAINSRIPSSAELADNKTAPEKATPQILAFADEKKSKPEDATNKELAALQRKVRGLTDEIEAKNTEIKELSQQTTILQQELDDEIDNAQKQIRELRAKLKKPVRSLGNQTIRYDKLSEIELKIEAALDAKTTAEFVDVPLSDVIEFLTQMHQIPIMLDTAAIEEAGIASSDEPVTISLKDAQLESLLNRMLSQLGLDFIVENDAMSITTKEHAEEKPVARVYSVRNVSDSPLMDSKALAEVIEETIEPESWSTVGGSGVIKPIGDGLIINQSQPIHRKIVELLDQLIRHSQQPPKKSAAPTIINQSIPNAEKPAAKN